MALINIVYALGDLVVALFFTIYYILESLVMSLVPRHFKRKDVAGDIVLVTGGGSGIGRLMCLKFAARGAKIVTWDIDAAANDETIMMVRDAGGEATAYTVDLSDRHAIYKAAEKVKEEVGKVDILINNAGIVTGMNFMDSPDDLVIRTFDVNIMSHFWTTKAFLGDMITANKGHVVTVASLAGLAGVNKLADYCASKFAAVGFDESLRLEMLVEGHTGVNTTSICPYFINTGMFDGVHSKLIPILEPDYAATEIVDGVLMNLPQVILPHFCSFLLLLKVLLPIKATDILAKSTGATCYMDEFTGRKKDK